MNIYSVTGPWGYFLVLANSEEEATEEAKKIIGNAKIEVKIYECHPDIEAGGIVFCGKCGSRL